MSKKKPKEHIIRVPRNYVLDGKRVGIGGKLEDKNGKVIKEATVAQYKQLYKLFPGMFEEVLDEEE